MAKQVHAMFGTGQHDIDAVGGLQKPNSCLSEEHRQGWKVWTRKEVKCKTLHWCAGMAGASGWVEVAWGRGSRCDSKVTTRVSATLGVYPTLMSDSLFRCAKHMCPHSWCMFWRNAQLGTSAVALTCCSALATG